MKQIIKHLKLNMIDENFVKSIAFCWICEPGSLGGPDGRITFINKIGEVYYCNFVYEDSDVYIEKNNLIKEFEKFGLRLELDSVIAITLWNYYYLGGYGNYLYVRPDIDVEFSELAKDVHPIDLYNGWMDIAQKILSTHEVK